MGRIGLACFGMHSYDKEHIFHTQKLLLIFSLSRVYNHLYINDLYINLYILFDTFNI